MQRAQNGGAGVPKLAIGYRYLMDGWARAHSHLLDAFEITIDHCLNGGPALREAADEIAHDMPVVAHGIGLSIGTDVPLDLDYLDMVAHAIDRLGASHYSEHLAFTRVPGRDLMNLLPVPRVEQVAESIAEKVRVVRSRIPVPFLLENIAYVFEWPGAEMSEGEFLRLVLAESGAGLLLDVENVRLNALNHGFDARAFLEALPAGVVGQVHVAGGMAVDEDFLDAPFFADAHSYPVPDETLDLLDCVLARQTPEVIILERDERMHATDEILADLARIRARLDRLRDADHHVQPASDRAAD